MAYQRLPLNLHKQKLHEGVKAVQEFCGQEFARQFE
jgi:hypothetical protein